MRNSIAGRIYCSSHLRSLTKTCFYSTHFSHIHHVPIQAPSKPGLHRFLDSLQTRCISLKPTSCFYYITPLRHLHATTEQTREESVDDYASGEVEPIDSWEEEDEAEPEVCSFMLGNYAAQFANSALYLRKGELQKSTLEVWIIHNKPPADFQNYQNTLKVGDGGDGGGVVLKNCPWGEKTLSIAQEVLQEFGEGMEIYSFKTSFRGYIYVRLDKLANEYGCPSMDDIESFSRKYKKQLDEVGARGEIPDDLALEVSSPGADRLLRVPDDLHRFKDMPMVVSYSEISDAKCQEKNGVYFLDSIDTESQCCIWKLADVRENRDPSAKGRPLSRKQKDCRLKLPYDTIKRVTLYISYQ